MTGVCCIAGSCAAGGGSPYYFDPAATPVDDNENLLWFHNYTVPANGSVRGNGANDGLVSTVPADGGIRSVMLVNTETGGELLSCGGWCRMPAKWPCGCRHALNVDCFKFIAAGSPAGHDACAIASCARAACEYKPVCAAHSIN
jgi:hypothetical protein